MIIDHERKQDCRTKYTLEEMIGFNHMQKLNNSEFFIKMEQIESLFRVTFKAQDNPTKASIRECLNKIAEKNYKNTLKEITSIQSFGSKEFLDFFIENLIRSVNDNGYYITIYADFIKDIYNTLGFDQKKLLFSTFESSFVPKCSTNICYCKFLGSIAKNGFFSKDKTFSMIQGMLSKENDDSIEMTITALYSAGAELEIYSPVQYQSIINRLEELTQKGHLCKRIMFMITDFVAERLSGWKGQNSQGFSPVEAFSQKDFDDSLLLQYIEDHFICPYWSKRMTYDLIFALCLTSRKTYRGGVEILKDLHERDPNGFVFSALKSLSDVFSRINQKKLEAYPKAIENCGAVFSQLLILGVQPAVYGTPLIPFRIEFLVGMLTELERVNQLDLVRDSPWFSERKYLPKFFSYSKILHYLMESGFFDVWEFFDVLYDIFDHITKNSSAQELASFIKTQVEPTIVESNGFIEFLTEVLLMLRPTHLFPLLLTYITKKPEVSFLQIVRLGEVNSWKPEQTAAQIRNLSKRIEVALDSFMRKEHIGDYHAKVVHYLS